MIYLHLSWQPQPRDGNSCAFRIYWLRDVVVAFWVLPYAQVWRTQWYMFLYCFGILIYIRFMFNCLNMDSICHICSLYCHISLSRDETFIKLGHWNKISTTWKLWRCLIAWVSAEKWEKNWVFVMKRFHLFTGKFYFFKVFTAQVLILKSDVQMQITSLY